jgi:hypothetical protein
VRARGFAASAGKAIADAADVVLALHTDAD